MKQFTCADDIYARTDEYRQQIIKLRLSAASKHNLADHLRDTEEAWRIVRLRAMAGKMDKQIKWREARLETLKAKLGEILTMQLPTMETDSNE